MGVKYILFKVFQVNGISHDYDGNAIVVRVSRMFKFDSHWLILDENGNEFLCREIANWRRFTRPS